MAKTPQSDLDPKTGKPLPKGVTYRNGAYQARAMVKGQRFTETFTSGSLAKRWLSELKASVSLGQFKDTRTEQKTTIRSLIETYRDKRMANRDSDRVGHIPYLLDSNIARLSVADWKPKDVRIFRDGMTAEGFADSTVVKRMNLLASVIQYAISELDIHTINHASGRVVKRPEGADKKRNRRLLTVGRHSNHDEYEQIVEAVTSPSFPDDVWLFRWSVETACRLGESLSLFWEDVDFEHRTIDLHRFKGQRYREEHGPDIRPISPSAMQVLENKAGRRFGELTGNIFSVGREKAFSARFGRITRKAGIKDITFHDMRHEATCRLARTVKNPLDLMRFTGHKDIKSLGRYYNVSAQELAGLFD